MPNINIDDAYILNETGAQVDKVTGLFTKDENTDAGEKAFAQLNIGTAGSNRNLLDNPWFTAGNVVNQRGVATIPHTQYGIDRWKGEHGSATITVTNAGLAYQGTSADLYQTMESSLRTFLNGKTLTASVLKSDGTIESGSAVFTNGAKTQFIYNSETGADVFVSAVGNFNLRYLNRTSAVTVVACKLELGSVSTLANDAPPDYGEELAKCIYSTADPTDTYANNGFGRSNRNLLDNPWWGSGEVVNQRGFTSGSTAHNVYRIDRWKTSYGSTAGTISLGANGLTITAASGTYALINQIIDNYAKLTGKTVTCSAMLSNGTVISGTIANLNWDASPVAVTSGNVRLQMFGQGYFRVTILNGGSATIRAVKLELGSVSTLANDAPPDYGEELLKCMRYFQRIKASAGTAYIGTGVCFTSQAYCVVNLPVPLRTTSVTTAINGVLSVQIPGSVLTASGQTFYVRTPSTIMIAATISGATAGQACLLALKDSGDYIDLSAEL